mmetsp:Transcript_75591/g.179629  ORF Transcript_75591/g.179629 Transcript_75591/m.179629 type:complete len:235 (+) Transcript_75591:46-750(+)
MPCSVCGATRSRTVQCNMHFEQGKCTHTRISMGMVASHLPQVRVCFAINRDMWLPHRTFGLFAEVEEVPMFLLLGRIFQPKLKHRFHSCHQARICCPQQAQQRRPTEAPEGVPRCSRCSFPNRSAQRFAVLSARTHHILQQHTRAHVQLQQRLCIAVHAARAQAPTFPPLDRGTPHCSKQGHHPFHPRRRCGCLTLLRQLQPSQTVRVATVPKLGYLGQIALQYPAIGSHLARQ